MVINVPPLPSFFRQDHPTIGATTNCVSGSKPQDGEYRWKERGERPSTTSAESDHLQGPAACPAVAQAASIPAQPARHLICLMEPSRQETR